MNSLYGVLIAVLASVLSGFSTALYAGIKESKKEKERQAEKAQDVLKIELKDLKIHLYQVEKDLTDWKDKYYLAIQELISVKSELEETLIKLSLINMEFKIEQE